MTLEDLVELISRYPLALAGILGVPPLLSILLYPVHGPQGGSRFPWKFVYSLLVYAVCIPGTFATVLTAYLLLFRNENVLKLDLIVYILPIVSMVVTLLLMRRAVKSFDEVPGFGRLSGLMLMLGISFGIAFALHRMSFGIIFIAPLAKLGAIALVVFALLHWGSNKFSGKKETRSLGDVIKGEESA
jgi:hypothetical protein